MDTKLNRFATSTALLIILSINTLLAQNYNIHTLDGNNASIQLSLDDNKQLLSVAYYKDSIYFPNVYAIKVVKILYNNFLYIEYSVRAGVGMNAARTLIITVNNNKLYQSLIIDSYLKEEFMDFSQPTRARRNSKIKTLYVVDINPIQLQTGTDHNYVLNAKTHSERETSQLPKNNKKNESSTNLNFDKNLNIFYNSSVYIAEKFEIFEPRDENKTDKYIKGTFPTIELGNDKYIYINQEWYEFSNKKTLHKYSYR